jgi:hypothetical protein
MPTAPPACSAVADTPETSERVARFWCEVLRSGTVSTEPRGSVSGEPPRRVPGTSE